jgi:fructose-1,6-bisphosphatase/inositol monophosphatase family enzyme
MTESELLNIAVKMARAGGVELRRFTAAMDSGVVDPGKAVAKAPSDYQVEADRCSEIAIIAELRRHISGEECYVLAEETGFSGDPDAPLQVVIDPLDGTSNFMVQLSGNRDDVAINVAFVDRHGQTLAAVTTAPLQGDGGEIWTATAHGPTKDRFGNVCRVRPWNDLPRYLAFGIPFKRQPSDAPSDLAVQVAQFLPWAQAIGDFNNSARVGPAGLDLVRVATGIAAGYVEADLGGPWDWVAGELLVQRAGGKVTLGEKNSIIAGSPDGHDVLLHVARGEHGLSGLFGAGSADAR